MDYTVNAGTGYPLVTGPEGHAAAGSPVRGSGLPWHSATLRWPPRETSASWAEAEVNRVDRPRIGNHVYGSFARDFTTRDGGRVMVVALTARHWADLLAVTGLQAPVSALADALGADFSAEKDRYTYRHALAGPLQHWFDGQGISNVRKALAATSVLWSVYRSLSDVAESGEVRANPMMGVIDQPGVGQYLAPARRSTPVRQRPGSRCGLPCLARTRPTSSALTSA